MAGSNRSRKPRAKAPPAPPADVEVRHARYAALAASPMNRDANEIAERADELRDLLQSFVDKYDDETQQRLLAAKGIPFDPAAWNENNSAAYLLEDAAGLLWALGVFQSVFAAQLVPVEVDLPRKPR